MFHRNTEASLGHPQQQNHDSYISKSRPLLSGGAATSFSPRSKSRQKQRIQLLLTLTPIVVLLWLLLRWFQQGTASSPAYTHAPVLISYAYFEKDTIQQFNFDYFLQAGKQPSPTGQRISWFFVVSTDQCGPCSIYLNTLIPRDALPEIGAKSVASSANGDTVLMHRTQNTGMDIGSHNVTLSYLKLKRTLWNYAYYIFINSSTKGPFYPSYMPERWHWTHAFLSRFIQKVKAVGASLVCLPPEDAGGPGPRLESWAYALDRQGLRLVLAEGAYTVRSCKTCRDDTGIIVGGEYRLSEAILKAGLNLATLMSKYDPGVDWRMPEHWNCNDNAHPSRHGTYDGIAFHPYETLFVKSSWHVADPYTKRYSTWKIQHLSGDAGTEGELNPELYRYAISPQAISPNLLGMAYDVLKIQKTKAAEEAKRRQEAEEAAAKAAAEAEEAEQEEEEAHTYKQGRWEGGEAPMRSSSRGGDSDADGSSSGSSNGIGSSRKSIGSSKGGSGTSRTGMDAVSSSSGNSGVSSGLSGGEVRDTDGKANSVDGARAPLSYHGLQDVNTNDAGVHDAGVHDAGEHDAGEHVAGEHVAGEHDAGVHGQNSAEHHAHHAVGLAGAHSMHASTL